MNEILYNKIYRKPKIYVEFSNEIADIPYEESKKSFLILNIMKKNKYKLQFFVSFFIALIFIVIFILNIIKSNSKEKISHTLLSNYKLTTSYSNSSASKAINVADTSPFVVGIIKIDKIALNYPIISETNEELLKISVCKFAGPMPNEIGNLCIAGHNYIDNKFFSRLNELSVGDIIEIYDLSGSKINYTIFQKQIVDSTDLTCTNQNVMGQKQITLITCSNTNNSKRLIIKAKNKKT